ncbi:hypothetical protein D3C77_805310 [compost metagenome]
MGHHDHRNTFFRDFTNDRQHLAYKLRVQSGRRFIKQNYLRLQGKRPGDAHPLLLSARELTRIGIKLTS